MDYIDVGEFRLHHEGYLLHFWDFAYRVMVGGHEVHAHRVGMDGEVQITNAVREDGGHKSAIVDEGCVHADFMDLSAYLFGDPDAAAPLAELAQLLRDKKDRDES